MENILCNNTSYHIFKYHMYIEHGERTRSKSIKLYEPFENETFCTFGL